jgi:hypothetical protein
VVDKSEDWGFGVCMLLNLIWINLTSRSIRRRSGKIIGLKATPQKTRCMILIGNPLGGNLVAIVIFSIHTCVL